LRISIHAIGRMKQGPERELVGRYLGRAQAGGKLLGLSGFDVVEGTESRAGSAATRKSDEAKVLRGGLVAAAVVVALDEGGKGIGSEAFAHLVARWRDDGKPAAAFLIGGADGLDPELLAAADLKLSFSPLTWPHQLVRIMLAEQLYRATTILSGHPYHRE
jgi:23S rRNA (pseudouridine1915-N3)-methyltransferase